MNDSLIDLDVNSILHNIQEVTLVVGEKWLFKKIKEEEKRNKRRKQTLKNRKHSYLSEPSAHPLVLWAMDVGKWRKSCLESGRLEINQTILKYSALGRSLSGARQQTGFKKLVARIKTKSEFYSAAFEAEVASSYLKRGWQVEFVEEGDNRTPDLKVTKDDDSVFWVECKCRDILTKRDKVIDSFWKELQSSLLRILGPKKVNGVVFIKSISDPVRDDIGPLKDYICSQLDLCSPGFSEGKEVRSHLDPTGKYHVGIQRLTAADEEIQLSGIGFNSSEEFEKVSMVSEMKVDDKGDFYVKNPVILAYQNATPSDKVSGVIHAFKSAAGQLPENGPGVIWIRIPDNAWSQDLEGSFNKARKIIEKELSGSHNRRVNAVILMTRMFEEFERDGNKGAGYKPLRVTIEHVNPRVIVV